MQPEQETDAVLVELKVPQTAFKLGHFSHLGIGVTFRVA